jgi:hypothetical protein
VCLSTVVDLMSRPSTVDHIAGLFPNLSYAPVSTGLSCLLAISLVEASCCELLWEMIDINIPLHLDSIAAELDHSRRDL